VRSIAHFFIKSFFKTYGFGHKIRFGKRRVTEVNACLLIDNGSSTMSFGACLLTSLVVLVYFGRDIGAQI
jgi:hypothetical protein